MGKSKKPSFADKLKANLAKAGDEAAKVAKKGLEAAKDGAHVVAEKAGEAKAYVDTKSRELLDKAYAKKRDLAAEHLQKVRAKHPKATPVEIQQELEKELHANEEKLGAESETFSTAVTIYVLASFEVHGAKPSDSEAHQKLIDAILVLDSEVSKGIQKYGGLAVELLLGRVKTAGKVAKIALDASKKIAKFQPLIKTLGIQNIGKQSMSAIVISATKKNLGETPTAWKA